MADHDHPLVHRGDPARARDESDPLVVRMALGKRLEHAAGVAGDAAVVGEVPGVDHDPHPGGNAIRPRSPGGVL